MKQLMILAIFLGAGLAVYRCGMTSSPAYRTYVEFADAMLDDRWDDARRLAGSDSVMSLIDRAQTLPRRVGQETYRNIRGVVHMDPARRVATETESRDGDKVTFRIVQDVRRGPPTMSPVGRPTVRHKQRVVVALTAEGWRVKEFEEEMEPLSAR